MNVSAAGLRCEECHRLYPLLSSNILQLLPSHPVVLPEGTGLAAYREGYLCEFFRPFETKPDAQAWGAPEARSRKWLRLRERQARQVLLFLWEKTSGDNTVFCDLSAAAGHCTFIAAREYRYVFHCDLSMDALVYASAKARANHLDNMVFVHADYFQPPFRGSIHHLVCLDTLIRGPWHEQRLLQSIQSVLATGGHAVVDFHDWWHNPLRRLGLLPDNFIGNKSYTRTELAALLRTSGIGQFETQPFMQEVDPRSAWGKIIAGCIPPTRFMVRLAGAGASALQASYPPHQEGQA
ncbi:MAG: class I SAM-dependent methyltransferase [Candidatus Acidiferrum sp.]